MQPDTTPSKEVRQLMLKRIIEAAVVSDTRSAFDKNVNVEKFRDDYFSEGSEYIKNNPGYRIRSEQLRTNEEVLMLIREDFKNYLLKQVPQNQVAEIPDNFNIYHFSHFNVISDDFIVETQMLNVSCKNANNEHIMSLGYGFMYLADNVTGNKIFIGSIKMEKSMNDTHLRLEAVVIDEPFSVIFEHVAKQSIVSFFVEKTFTGLRNSLLKNTKNYKVKIMAAKHISKRNPYNAHRLIINDIKSLSPSLIDVIQLVNIRKHLY